MIVITEIKYLETKEPFVRLMRHMPFDYVQCMNQDGDVTGATVEELVVGRRFIGRHGKSYMIGMAEQPQQAVGIVWEAFDNMERENTELRNKLHKARKQIIAAWRPMPLWDRLLSRWLNFLSRCSPKSL